MKLTLENKRIARHQLINPNDEDTQNDEEQTQDQKNFLVATSEPPVVPPEKETILLSTTPTNEPQGPPTLPNDGPISEQIADRLLFSNYLISPALSSYNKVFDATTIAFAALHA